MANDRACSICDGPIPAESRSDRTVCSTTCRNRRERLRESPEHRRKRIAYKNAKSAEYNRRWRRTPAGIAASRARSKWRRAQTKGATVVEVFDSHEIFDRDAWKCHLCGRRVGQRYRFPHPRSASLDHIVPLTRGGQHTRANAATAHLGCNMAKSNGSVNDQLRLIG